MKIMFLFSQLAMFCNNFWRKMTFNFKNFEDRQNVGILHSERVQGFAADPDYGRAKCLPMLGALKI